MIIYAKSPGHITKLAAMSIYGKRPLKFSSLQPEGLIPVYGIGTWYEVNVFWDVRITYFVQMMSLG